MDPSPRQIALLALLALVPYAAYATLAGELTLLTAVIGAINILLIAGSLTLLFGPVTRAETVPTNGSDRDTTE